MTILQQDVILWVVILLVAVSLIRWHLNPRNGFNLADLICTDKKLNDKKFMRTGAFVVMTYGFYSLVEDGKLTEAYATLYGMLWVGNAALDKWQRQREPK